jgi:hypothetical protein
VDGNSSQLEDVARDAKAQRHPFTHCHMPNLKISTKKKKKQVLNFNIFLIIVNDQFVPPLIWL